MAVEQSNLRFQTAGAALYTLSQIARRTGRYQVSGEEHLAAAQASGRPVILAAWHGMTMLLAGYFSQILDPASLFILMPDDWRGGALAAFATRLGATPFPVNLKGEATMASARRIVTLVRQLQQGKYCYITPDGPDGPPFRPKPGITFMADKADAIIIPSGAFTRQGFRLNRWDQYVIPYPFARIAVRLDRPLRVGGQESAAGALERLTDRLHRTSAQAIADYYSVER